MKKVLKIILISLLLNNLSFAGTITNATINTGRGGESSFNKGGNGGNLYSNGNDISNITINVGKYGNSTFNEKGKDGRIFINNQHLDIKKCFNKLNLTYNEKKVKITIVDNQNIKINDKTINIDKCLVKNK